VKLTWQSGHVALAMWSWQPGNLAMFPWPCGVGNLATWAFTTGAMWTLLFGKIHLASNSSQF